MELSSSSINYKDKFTGLETSGPKTVAASITSIALGIILMLAGVTLGVATHGISIKLSISLLGTGGAMTMGGLNMMKIASKTDKLFGVNLP